MSRAAFAILTPITAIILGVLAYSSNFNFWKDEFYRYDVYRNFDSLRLVDAEAQDMIKYFVARGDLDGYFFNSREKQHLADVKNLIQRARIVFWVNVSILLLIFLFLSNNGYKKRLVVCLKTGAFTLILCVFVGLIFGILSFNNSFLIFHKIFFENDSYLLDPTTDNLIKMFPQGFFVDVFLRILLALTVISLIMFIGAETVKRRLTLD